MAFEDIFPHLGEFGRYQTRIYILLCLTAVSGALHKLAGVFLQANMRHRCQLPFENETATYSLSGQILNASYPWDETNEALSSCERFLETNSTEFLEYDMKNTITCHRWIYDKSVYKSSTVMEFDLVCSSGWLRAVSDSMFMLGDVIGSFMFGLLSDSYGRKPIFMVAVVLQVIGGILVSISPQYFWFIIFRFLVGSTVSGLFLVGYVIAMEMVGPSTRLFAGVACQLFFTFGYVMTALFAYLIPEWRMLQVAVTLPSLIFLTYWWFIPESNRWLIANGRPEQARNLLLKAAKENNTKIPDDILNRVVMGEHSEQPNGAKYKKYSIIDVMRHPNLRNRSLNLFFNWFANNSTYYGLSWNTSNLGGNDYINFVIAGLVEVPAYTFVLLTLNRWGRRTILCFCMLLSAAALLIAAIVPTGMLWLFVTFAMIGKLAITASYGTIYIFTAEQFPTVVRNVALGASSTCARAGGMTAPYINLLTDYWQPLPLLVFGAIALTAGLLALRLPETLHQKLPDTMEEGENFGKPSPVADVEIQLPDMRKVSV